MKSKEDTEAKYKEEWKGWEDEKYDDINKFLGQLDSPSSPRQYPANIAQLYPDCVNVDNYSPSPSILIDFNNGRLGNQISGVASVFCLASTLNITPMMTHKTFNQCSMLNAQNPQIIATPFLGRLERGQI